MAEVFDFPPTDQENGILNDLQMEFEVQSEQMVFQSHVQAGDLLLSGAEKSRLSELFALRQEILKILDKSWPQGQN